MLGNGNGKKGIGDPTKLAERFKALGEALARRQGTRPAPGGGGAAPRKKGCGCAGRKVVPNVR